MVYTGSLLTSVEEFASCRIAAKLLTVTLWSKNASDHTPSGIHEHIIVKLYRTQSDVFAVYGTTLCIIAREDQIPVRCLGVLSRLPNVQHSMFNVWLSEMPTTPWQNSVGVAMQGL